MKTSEYVAAQLEEAEKMIKQYEEQLDAAYQRKDVNAMSLASNMRAYYAGRKDILVLMESKVLSLESEISILEPFKEITLQREGK